MMPPNFNTPIARLCVLECAKSYDLETLSTPYAHCLGSEAPDFGTIIAFRGSKTLRDWITDFSFPKTNLGFCSVHVGFWRAIQSIIDQVRHTWPKEENGIPVRYYIAGHSLGGALATLCAGLLAREGYSIFGVYTFGCPRVGDARFARIYNSLHCGLGDVMQPPVSIGLPPDKLGAITFRLVDQEDIVPRMPPCFFGYRHVGREIFYPSFGAPISGAKLWFKVLSDVVGTYLDWQRGRIAQFADHPIANYTNQLNTTDSVVHQITEELKK